MNANELADVFDTYDEPHDWGTQAVTMLRQQQAEMEELEKENTDLRYLIATKLEQQDGISLNSMAHPITNTLEPSYEIDPNKLETIEIDLPNIEPVAWMPIQSKHTRIQETKPEDEQNWIPLYLHPAKTLTDEEIDVLVHEYNCIDDYPHEFVRACIKKASEK